MANTYYTSTGEALTTDQINRKIDKAGKKLMEDQRDEYGYNFCVECKRSSGCYFHSSHTISRKKAKETKRSELCWNLNNLRVLCEFCHREFDGLN